MKVVLAYSGGLDTSAIVPWLKESYQAEVICYCSDVGQGDELEGLEERAYQSGASQVVVEDLKEAFLTDYVFKALRAGAVYERAYLLGTALARPLIASRQVAAAHRLGADAVAHGCTGKGNDQVRFELTYQALDPTLRVIAPWREWELKSREDVFDYLRSKGVPYHGSRTSLYSRDRNLWHMSHEGGVLEDPARRPDPSIWQLTADPTRAPDAPAEVTVGFERGTPVSLDGRRVDPVTLVQSLNETAAAHGVGRVDLVENRLVGMKSRGLYETPGGTVLCTAQAALETITLDRETLHYKDLVAQRYAELVYYGQWFTTLRQALDAFVDVTQREVTGEVTLQLYKGRATVLSRSSPRSLYREDLATFGHTGPGYDHQDAEGFIRLFGLPLKVRSLMAMDHQAAPPDVPVHRD